jgi:hydrogenase expression/formation protein HypC
MQVIEASADQALAEGRGRVERLDTRLIGACQPGEWLLVFQGAARDRLDAQRATEINTTLDMLEACLVGDAAGAQADAGFALPSAMTAAQLAALSGQPPTGEKS